jgi:hypothetical protein
MSLHSIVSLLQDYMHFFELCIHCCDDFNIFMWRGSARMRVLQPRSFNILLWRGSARKRELQPHGIYWLHHHCCGAAVHASVNCSHTVFIGFIITVVVRQCTQA